jgi:hypothetical protein
MKNSSPILPLHPVITDEGDEQYQVEKLVDWRAEDVIWKCRVRWEGYGPLDDTWEPASKLLHLEDQLQEFYANYLNMLKPDDPLPVAKAPVKRQGGWLEQALKSKTSFLSPSALSAQLCLSKPPSTCSKLRVKALFLHHVPRCSANHHIC